MKTKTIPKQIPGSEAEILDGETVLYTSDMPQAIYLNETASLIWHLIDGNRDLGTIQTLLSDAYPDDDTIKQDIEQTLAQLIEHGVVQL